MSDMDGKEPTAWEDLGPQRTGSVPQRAQQSRSSGRNNDVFRNELTACLALVAPAGMSEENRRDWFVAAWDALKHLPADLLQQGCAKARQTCDHPAKIVPAIIEETREQLRMRREYGEGVPKLQAQMAPKPLTREELDTMPSDIRDMGLSSGFLAIDADGKLIEAPVIANRAA
jgi:hypothetical protein